MGTHLDPFLTTEPGAFSPEFAIRSVPLAFDVLIKNDSKVAPADAFIPPPDQPLNSPQDETVLSETLRINLQQILDDHHRGIENPLFPPPMIAFIEDLLQRKGPETMLDKIQLRKVKDALDLYTSSLIAANAETPTVRVLLSESKDLPLPVAASRLEMAEEILEIITEGYRIRDLTRAQGGTKHLWDLVTLPRKIFDWATASPTSMVDIWTEWAEDSYQRRKLAVAQFLVLLEKHMPPSGRFESIEEAKGHIQTILNEIGRNYSPASAGLGGSSFGYGVVPGLDRYEVYLAGDYPLDLLAKLLSLPPGNIPALAHNLLETGDWLLEDDVCNWVAADYIYKQLQDTALLEYPDSTYIENKANDGRGKIRGNPENYNPTFAKVIPHFWQSDDLSYEYRYAMAEDVVSWLVPLGGSVKIGAAFRAVFQTARRGGIEILTRLPRLNRFVSMVAQVDHKTVADLQRSVLRTLGRGEQPTFETLQNLARKDPAFIERLVADGHVIPKTILKTADQTLALYAVQLGQRTERIARSLGVVGGWSWRYLIKPPTALAKLVTKGLGVTGRLGWRAVQASMPKLANWLTQSLGNLVAQPRLITMGQGLAAHWKSTFGIWVGMQVYGAPFARDPADQTLDWQVVADFEERGNQIQNGFTNFRLETEELNLQHTFNEVFEELGRKNISTAHLIIKPLSASPMAELIKEKLLNSPLLAEIGLVYLDPQVTIVKAADFGQPHTQESLSSPLTPLKPFHYVVVQWEGQNFLIMTDSNYLQSVVNLI